MIGDACTKITPHDAYKFLFDAEYGQYDCTRRPLPPSRRQSGEGGRKFTRGRTHSSRRHRRHAQRGGAVALGQHAQAWAEAAENWMTVVSPVLSIRNSSPTLRFYRLIIFVDIIHLLKLDTKPIGENIGECNRLAEIICIHLETEEVLTAYFTAKFGSRYAFCCGMAGATYAAGQCGALPYFTQLLAYISSLTSSLPAPVYEFAVTLVDSTMDIMGLSASFYGIINWGLLMYSVSKTYREYGKPHVPDYFESAFAQRWSTKPLGIIYTFVFKPLVTSGIFTAYEAFSQIPRLFTAARGCITNPRDTARAACDTASRLTLEKLVKSTNDKIEIKLFCNLGETFSTIITKFRGKDEADRLYCTFISQFAQDEGGADLIRILKVPLYPAEARPASTAAPPSSAPDHDSRATDHDYRAEPSRERSRSGTRNGQGDGAASVKPGRGHGTGVRNRGGSSKHKKNHSRPTNKRKLLVKRIRRRRTKNKGKW